MTKSTTFSIVLIFVLALSINQAFAGDSDGMGAKQWYKESYAPLWENPTAENMDAAMAHYSETMSYHGAEGEVMVVSSREFLEPAIAEWAEEQWVRSEMVELKTNKINDSTYAFTSKWLDQYEQAEDGYSCGWYLVGKTEDGWRITTFADHACEE